MYLNKLEPLINEHPEWKDSLNELASVLTPGKEYSFRYLTDRIPSVSPQRLSLILSDLASRGILERIIRVESPETGGGIGDFKSLLDVPEEVFDYRTSKNVSVTPDKVVTIFKVLPEAA
jgi:hypothetical protein